MDAPHIIKNLMYGLAILPTVFGNGLILVSVYKFKNLRSNMHILIANLAASDLLVGIVLLPMVLIQTLLDLTQYKYACLSVLAVFVVCLGSSCYNLMLISIERYFAIVYPLKTNLLTSSKMVAAIAVGWFVAISAGIAPVLGWNKYGNNTNLRCYDINIWDDGYLKWINLHFFVFLILNFVLFLIVARKALTNARSRALSSIEESYVHRRAQKDLHHVVTMVIVLGLFAVCWLPYIIMFVVELFSDDRQVDYIRRLLLIPGLLNSALNWIVYGYRNKDFRRSFQIILKTCLCRKRTS